MLVMVILNVERGVCKGDEHLDEMYDGRHVHPVSTVIMSQTRTRDASIE